jgi:hypothetical protein
MVTRPTVVIALNLFNKVINMSKFFNPNDFSEWKKVTKAISDHLRENPNTSNPAKLMHVLANEFGYENTQAFKAFLEDSSKTNEKSLMHLFSLGNYDDIINRIEELTPTPKTKVKLELRDKSMRLMKHLVLFFCSKKQDYKYEYGLLDFIETLDPENIANLASNENEYSSKSINASLKMLNSWYLSLPGNTYLQPSEWAWDSPLKVKKSTLNAINKLVNVFRDALHEEYEQKVQNEIDLYIEALGRFSIDISGYLAYSKEGNELILKIKNKTISSSDIVIAIVDIIINYMGKFGKENESLLLITEYSDNENYFNLEKFVASFASSTANKMLNEQDLNANRRFRPQNKRGLDSIKSNFNSKYQLEPIFTSKTKPYDIQVNTRKVIIQLSS